jgi:hypothetical protein
VDSPNFLICGAAKSGTTSLASYLRQHPEVFVAREKESHYFICKFGTPTMTGPGDQSQFAPLLIGDEDRYRLCFSGVRGESATGEASVYYLYQPDSMAAALEANPEMRFVCVLRDPVGRAFSAFSHQRRDGWEPMADFEEALSLEDDRVADGWGWGWHYRRVSQYAPQLRAVREVIPADKLHFLLYEDLRSDPVVAMQRVFSFLGVDPTFVCDSSLVFNASGTPKAPAINRILTHQNRLKSAVKRVVPYGVGQKMAERVRNWNLEGMELPSTVEQALSDRFLAGTSRDELTELIGSDLSSWSVFLDA